MEPEIGKEIRDIALRLATVMESDHDLLPHLRAPIPVPVLVDALAPAPVREPEPAPVREPEPEPVPAHAPVPAAPGTAQPQPPDLSADVLSLRDVVETCARCTLAGTRTRVVFGEGPVGAKVMFVGEGPGEQEDRTGRPFVGPAGQLLDRMIEAMKLGRGDCYIANVVKCRPPGNATPVPEWTVACAPYLERQIELVRPRVLVALGTPAANFLTGTTLGVVRLRGRLHRRGDIPLVVTYHPAALLRDPGLKRFAWEDLKMVMARLRGV